MKWYVVFKGRRPGVYGDSEACQLQVTGFSHASYKSYNKKEEAMRAFYGKCDVGLNDTSQLSNTNVELPNIKQ
ncbi:hypothetical protein C2845_PM08G12850 [Panicum miliaceum]|uniref:Ribonuclease H1 N-terminal domain-containing protein n=1 Tax=Panicum miliaceum TaxID=4540 RepID=A0A3L6R247_PANMI|nr:hypothetical protein C2845_PM08G12850 [Panicum miliaceum]